MPPLPQTISVVHFLTETISSHTSFSPSIGALTAKVDGMIKFECLPKIVCVCIHIHTNAYAHTNIHTHTNSNSERELGGTYFVSRHHVSIRVQVIFDQWISIGHRKCMPNSQKGKRKSIFSLCILHSPDSLASIWERERESKSSGANKRTLGRPKINKLMN